MLHSLKTCRIVVLATCIQLQSLKPDESFNSIGIIALQCSQDNYSKMKILLLMGVGCRRGDRRLAWRSRGDGIKMHDIYCLLETILLIGLYCPCNYMTSKIGAGDWHRVTSLAVMMITRRLVCCLLFCVVCCGVHISWGYHNSTGDSCGLFWRFLRQFSRREHC